MSSLLFGDTMVANNKTVRSVTAKPISFWIQLAADDIRKMVSPPKSTKRQFLCLHKYFLSVLRSIGRHLEASDHHTTLCPISLKFSGRKTSPSVLLAQSCRILSSHRIRFIGLAIKPHSIRKTFFLKNSTRVRRSLMILQALSPDYNYSRLFVI